MDKQKLLMLLKDVDAFAKDIEASFPKAQNKVNSLKWSLKAMRDEIAKPDPIELQGPFTATAGGDPAVKITV